MTDVRLKVGFSVLFKSDLCFETAFQSGKLEIDIFFIIVEEKLTYTEFPLFDTTHKPCFTIVLISGRIE